MIIVVSIVDKHKKTGKRHVGSYQFEIDYPGDSHFDFLTVACPVENEDMARSLPMNKLLSKEDMGEDVIEIPVEEDQRIM